jgi:cell shape-determining protein MreC
MSTSPVKEETKLAHYRVRCAKNDMELQEARREIGNLKAENARLREDLLVAQHLLSTQYIKNVT